MDFLGLFASHEPLSRKAFQLEKCRKFSGAAEFVSGLVDYMFWEGSQLPSLAYMHAMRNGESGESVEAARIKTNNYINNQMSRCNFAGLGRALHTEQDKWAAGHRGYQPAYAGFSFTHWWKEENGGGQDEAVLASVRLIRKFKEMCPFACGK